ncbi:toxin-antitoxin system HicB family antitoxin [Burkholderia sp. Ax-1719]|jgi:predicted HicB family RNase H-like nuclease|uniref:type II toxin-antitoxin system HicB family antitoxin n=1 Tax=Burkholderia sp. Ax-1719 TaxID=2608334 RepID=UPI00141E42EC|nr:toxin-antitoxin system HicB family antitoxin [Burkholderia sp. Ax-1719]NIE63622.1 toxin-antitoxin system HicB family antitoxin [Burkholderia sp. Ax-1719]
MKHDHYTYRISWSPEDEEHVGLCAEFPSLSWLDKSPEGALAGIRRLVHETVQEMTADGEKVPDPIADRSYSGIFKVRIPPAAHRALVIQATEEGVSLNRLASAKLCA